jgi:hypothetical protein
MKITTTWLKEQIQQLERQRDDRLTEAQQQIAAMNGAINFAQVMLEHMENPDPDEDGNLAAVGDSVQNHPKLVTEEEPDAPAELRSSADIAENGGQARVHIAESGEAGQLDILSPEVAMNAGTHRQE